MAPISRPGDVLRIGDSSLTVLRFSDEKNFVEFVQSRGLPSVKLTRQIQMTSYIRGAHSDWFYKQLEAAHEGIIDFRLDDTADPARNLMRVRSLRDVGFDGRLHQLKIGTSLEVTLEK
jgi:hypothetical protein